MTNIYYLETNALYQLSRQLVTDNRVARAIAYSSFLAIFELLSGMDSGTYDIRKAVLRNVIESRIGINWDTPGERIAEAFSIIGVTDKLRGRLQRLSDIALKSSNYDELLMLSETDPDSVSLNSLASMELIVTQTPAEDIQQQITLLRRDMPKERIKEYRDALESNQSFRDEQQRIGWETLLGRLAAIVASRMPGPPSHENLLKVLRSYSGRIQFFIQADAYRQEKSLTRAERPGKNDFIDISHFLYLERRDQIIVTDDRFLQQICANLFPQNYCSISDFKATYGWE